MRKALIAGSVLVAALATAPLAAGATRMARLGSITATLTDRHTGSAFADKRLTISRAGRVLYSRPVVSSRCAAGCQPVALRIVHLQAGREPEVSLEFFSGGAHCCTIEEVLWFDRHRGTYEAVEYDFGDPGFVLRDLGGDGRLEFVSADDEFAYRFTDGAASGMPVRVLAFRSGRFTDTTAAYPKLITADAARWLRAYRGPGVRSHDSVGLIAAWAADEDRLGHMHAVDRSLVAQARAGHLLSALFGAKMTGQRFITSLDTFLHGAGYVPMCGM